LTNLGCYLDGIDPTLYNSSAVDTGTSSATSFVATTGTWACYDGANEIDLSRHGTIAYNINIPSTGIWEFQVAAQAAMGYAGINVSIPVDVLIDGVRLGGYTMNAYNGAVCDISDLTQMLQAGTHTLQIVDRNYSAHSLLQIDGVAIFPPQGTIDPSNGVPVQLEAENTVNAPPAASYVSPICLEGKARLPAQATITSGASSTGVLSELDGQWYANAPLNSDGTATSIIASFEGGLLTSTNTITWSALNVLTATGTTTAIRSGDSLRLTAYPAGTQPGGSLVLTISNTGNVIFTGTTTGDVPIAYSFATSGTYTVQADWNASQSASITVQVKSASFGNPMFAYVGNAQTLNAPNVGTDLTVNWDTGLYVAENPPPGSGGRSFQVMPLTTGTMYGVARLSPGGPILARAEIDAYGAHDITATGDTAIVSRNPDGTFIVQSSIVIDALPPGGYVVLQIFVAGTTFLDGTTTKTLTASDFVNGVATYQMIWAGGYTSVCQTALIYDSQGNYLGACN
jgi:hypothetical protein